MTETSLEDRAIEPQDAEAARPDAPSLASTKAEQLGAEPAFDAGWTERVLNSLAAWGRRERGLIRAAHSDARNYVAYDSQAGRAVRTAAGTVDQGTVEISAALAAAGSVDVERAERAAPTVMLPRLRRRRGRSVALALFMAIAVFGALAIRRGERPAATTASVTPPLALSAVSVEQPREPLRTAEASAKDRPSSVPPHLAVARPPGSAEPQAAPPVPHVAPRGSASSSAVERPAPTRRAFVDLVNRY